VEVIVPPHRLILGLKSASKGSLPSSR